MFTDRQHTQTSAMQGLSHNMPSFPSALRPFLNTQDSIQPPLLGLPFALLPPGLVYFGIFFWHLFSATIMWPANAILDFWFRLMSHNIIYRALFISSPCSPHFTLHNWSIYYSLTYIYTSIYKYGKTCFN